METLPLSVAELLAATLRAYDEARAYVDESEARFLEDQAQREAAYRARVRARKAATKAAFMARWNAIPAETPERRRKRERIERRARELREWKAREAENARLLVAYRQSVCGTAAK